MKQPYCIVPWVTLTQGSSNQVKPCCVYKQNLGTDLKQAWHSEHMQQLRRDLKNNTPPVACQTCKFRKETLGRNHADWFKERITLPEDYDFPENPDFQLLHMDLNFGNKCNLKCRMCDSTSSTQWFKEDKKLREISAEFGRVPMQELVINDAEKFDYLKDHLSYCQRIDFKGGEPMMQEGMFAFLQKLINWDYAKNIRISYTTNGTVVDNRVFDLWPHFKRVQTVLSVDGTGDVYQYVRGGKNHSLDQVTENMRKFETFENFQGAYNIAIQIYNLLDLPNIINWIETVNLKHFVKQQDSFHCMVTNPQYLDIRILPDHIKRLAVDRFIETDKPVFRPIIDSLLKNPENARQMEIFKRFTKELDKIRGTDFVSIVPEFKSLF